MGSEKGLGVEKIKVLYITSLFGKMGGAERNIYDIVCNIDKNRFTPYVFCLKGGELVEEIKSKGINAKIIDLEKIFSIQGLKKGIDLFRFIRKEGIQVVVTYHHDADIWGGITAKLARVPIVISSRRDIGYQLQKKHVWMYRILNRFYTKIISVSDAVKREIVNREWADPDKIVTIYNGVKHQNYQCNTNKDDAAAIKESLGIEPSKIIIGALGAFRPIKGQIYLVKAIAEVVKKHSNIKVLMVGYKETGYYKEVQQLINELGLKEYFICTGDRYDIPRLLSIMDIFVLPSISEGLSNALLEAMSAGKPVIATHSGGNPEVVIHNETGLLVPPCGSTALSSAIQMLLEDEKLRNSIGSKGQNRVEKEFSLKKMVERNEELYEFLILRQNRSKFADSKSRYAYVIKKFVKLTLSYIIYYLGIAAIYKNVISKKPQILAYHSINKISLRSLEIEQDVRNFEQQMIYLKNNFSILSPSEFLACRNNGAGFPKNAVMITFDDGYRDNYINAFPILKKYNIPAIIFITTDPIETREPLFFDALRYAIINSPRFILDLRDIGLSKYQLDKKNELLLLKAIRDITEFSKSMDSISKSRLIHTIYERLWLGWEEVKNKKIYLSWDEISEMAGNGVEFGSHTKTHPQLSALTFEECKDELVCSKKIIEERTGRKARVIAYPFGWPNEFNNMVEKAAREVGYECAFSLYRDKNGLANNYNYTIGRKMVDSHMSSDFSGKFCKPLFAADIVGVYNH